MLRFCFGASGSGKSTGLYSEVIKRSIENPKGSYYIIVPDQFTMQTQKDVVKMHPSHAIMNIDVLSFGRLSHRIFEELSISSFSVLDDLGKSLVLRRVADILGAKLPVIGKNMHKPGYIDEVKSTISEFMQYGISDEALLVLEEKSASKGALNSKIKDLRLLYSEFLKYIEGKYITAEETLDVLCRNIPVSNLMKDSVIVFDGFTGFTPIQYRVIKALLEVAREVVVSLTISPDCDPYDGKYEEQELFMLSKKTVLDLEKLEYSGNMSFDAWRNTRNQEMKAGAQGDIFIKESPVKRLANNKPLSFLEQNLFRYKTAKYQGGQDSICIYTASSPLEEVRQTFIKISDLVREKGYEYRDIALVCGGLDNYSDNLEEEARKFNIPVYIDKNSSLLLNPFIEYITSAINIVISGYKYEDVFHYMRSGMTSFPPEDIDLLENYVRALGIKGRKQWEDKFLRRMPKKFKASSRNKDSEKEILLLEKLEGMREQISSNLKPLFDSKRGTVREITQALLTVIENEKCSEKLDAYKEKFKACGNEKKAREYEQVYDKILNLLKQMDELLGDEVLDLTEYRDILNAGFSEIEVGTIPQDVDRIIVGDIERTRLREVKVLFLIGVNDGYIPSGAGSGGLLSDIDRQFLLELDTGVELAPTPRQQMYIQRLYLYMNLTKPTDRLYLSYSELGADGKSLRPAYLIPKLLGMFPSLEVQRPEDGIFEDQLVTTSDSFDKLSEMIRKYALGILGDSEKENFITLYRTLEQLCIEDSETIKKITDAAFKRYEDKPLSRMVALSLYGANLENSVSRLEQFAGCCYAHFLKYGLRVEERKEYEFNAADLGNVFHEVLEKYTYEVMKGPKKWADVTKEESDELLNRILTECITGYGETILMSSARNQYMAERIRRILTRTVDTLKYQVSKGHFEPAFVEMDFRDAGNIDEINVTLSEDEKNNILTSMKLHGRIDRVDLYEDPDHVYVKVIDFKSSGHKFNVAALYYGLQLQLVMYMNVATAAIKKNRGGKDTIPAAVLYYHVDDPMAEGKQDLQPDDINKAIKDKLRTTGLVNENIDVINLLDDGLNGKSDVIPVELKKDGTVSARSTTVTLDDYKAISGFVDSKIKEFGNRILNGEIKVNPYEMGERSSCTYCSYRSICGYDEKIEGYSMRQLDISSDEAMENIRNQNN
ncbi:MAG: PD-(D/E)XK nuclease family protein [Butyrivibrio sp.]|uniref:PD-(D/E)XK nuclease family protein n=1 Tax=Butyrivibrio sp. TaxID=28121 RepID=UPI001B18D258|nr:PD-(D/E)XK nuclease family protein [Butyrivibrio sp.]MBO6241347.1 PD-(D/E)XK nuclease family protein [Butyrivibrio sp.]